MEYWDRYDGFWTFWQQFQDKLHAGTLISLISTKSKDYNTAKYRIKITKRSDISNRYAVLLQGRSVNDVFLTNGVICMYKTVNLKTKLFTKLTNQNSYDEARAIECI